MKEIQLPHGKVALVDDEDYEFLSQWNWSLLRKGEAFYATRYIKHNCIRKAIKMHREILGLTDSKIIVDHKDRNGLNNCKNNLRIATSKQNMANTNSRKDSTSKYLGVSWKRISKKWRATITKDYKSKHLGYFDSEEQAALAYNQSAIIYHGEFASLNKV